MKTITIATAAFMGMAFVAGPADAEDYPWLNKFDKKVDFYCPYLDDSISEIRVCFAKIFYSLIS